MCGDYVLDNMLNTISLEAYDLPDNIEDILDDYHKRHELYTLNYMLCTAMTVFLGVGAYFYYYKAYSFAVSILYSFFVSIFVIMIAILALSHVFEGLWNLFHRQDREKESSYKQYIDDLHKYQQEIFQTINIRSSVTIGDKELSHWNVYVSSRGNIFHRSAECAKRVRVMELREAVGRNCRPCSRCVLKSHIEYDYYMRHKN